MITLNDLFDLAEKGYILVFPTEEAARGFSVRYVQERKKGLKASSAIAFDTFSSLFFPEAELRECASEIDRIIFSNYASSHLSDSFRYFSSSGYPEVKERIAPYIKSMLQNLPEAFLLEKRSRAAENDLRLIEREYTVFLSRLGLYEPLFENIEIPEFANDYVLVMPAAFPKEERIAEAIKDNPHVHIVQDNAADGLCIRKFECEKEEIRALFCRIRDLLDKGVPYSDIVISTAAEDRLRLRLEEESYLFNIPLEFVSGSSPLFSPSGAFILSLSEIYDTSYSLDALKAFFLNPAIPFREPDELRRFIEFSISASITSAPSFEKDRYMKVPQAEGGSWYRTLRFTLDKLMSERDGDKVLQHLHALMAGLLMPEEFNGNEEDAAVYSFAMHEAEIFLKKAKQAEKAGYSLDRPLFPLFISYLESEKYVPRNKSVGIRVYPFTQDAALSARHRFIIALNDDESTVRVKKAKFLSDYEIKQERTDADITGDVLSSYALFSDSLYLSASLETYSGFVLPLSLLHSVDDRADGDSWRDEAVHRRCGRIYPLQRCGYEAAELASLRTVPPDESFAYEMKGHSAELPLSLSFSSFSSYVRCPYTYALKYVFGLDRLKSYVPAALDTAEMGTRLHRVLERYYKGEGGNPDEDIPRIFEEEMEGWKNGVGLAQYSPRATDLVIANLRSVYLKNLISISREMDSFSEPFDKGLEAWLEESFAESGFLLKGKVDRLALSPDGEGFLVFDYKSRNAFQKSELEKQSFQTYIYKLLVERKYGNGVLKAYFVSLRDGKLTEAPFELSDEEVIAALGRVSESIAGGDWHAEPSSENCDGCIYRSICRRRFVVR